MAALHRLHVPRSVLFSGINLLREVRSLWATATFITRRTPLTIAYHEACRRVRDACLGSAYELATGTLPNDFGIGRHEGMIWGQASHWPMLASGRLLEFRAELSGINSDGTTGKVRCWALPDVPGPDEPRRRYRIVEVPANVAAALHNQLEAIPDGPIGVRDLNRLAIATLDFGLAVAELKKLGQDLF